MRRYRQRNLVPPSGYYYIVPETALEVVAGDHDSLVLQVRRHYIVNNIPVPHDLSDRIERFICLHNAAEWCVGSYEPDDIQITVLSVKQVRDATRLLFHRLRVGDQRYLASAMEAERRARICARCEDNFRGMCTTCNGLKEYVSNLLSSGETANDHLLGVCAHCSCLLKAKVHVSTESLRKVTSISELTRYPSHCWMHDVAQREDESQQLKEEQSQ